MVQRERADRWIYRGIWSFLVQWFRVPDQPPSLPAVDGHEPERFRPAPGFLDYLRFFFWLINILIGIGTIVLLVVVIGVIVAQGGKGWLLLPLVVLLIVVDALFDVVAYVAIHLRYDTTWYVMSDRSLRIRRGIWVIQEVTATFENVQNVKISQGPLQRYFGIANLVVETAGGGGSAQHGGGVHRAIIEGISNPDRYREAIMARLRHSNSTGLGDEAEIDRVRRRGRRSTWTCCARSATRSRGRGDQVPDKGHDEAGVNAMLGQRD